MVWGIDSGWAADAFAGAHWDGAPRIRNVPPGKYDITVRVARPYAKLFRIPKAKRQVRFKATVVEAPPWWDDEPIDEDPLEEEPTMAMGAGADDGPVAAMATRAAQVPNTAVPTLRNPPRRVRPDLAATPAWNIFMDHRRGRDLLQFASTPWNAGPAPFVVEGFRRPGEDVMDAFQYFYDRDGTVVGRARVGTFRYHAGRGHDHWHFLQFAQFDLLDSSKQHVVKSKKQGFCLVPTDPVDLTVKVRNCVRRMAA